MNRAKRLYILLGVLVVVCAAAALVLRGSIGEVLGSIA